MPFQTILPALKTSIHFIILSFLGPLSFRPWRKSWLYKMATDLVVASNNVAANCHISLVAAGYL